MSRKQYKRDNIDSIMNSLFLRRAGQKYLSRTCLLNGEMEREGGTEEVQGGERRKRGSEGAREQGD